MPPAREIVKVQIFINHERGELPVISVRGGRIAHQPLGHDTRVAMGDDTCAFFDAEHQPSTGRWNIGTRVQDREW
jgi:hypothetical protein